MVESVHVFKAAPSHQREIYQLPWSCESSRSSQCAHSCTEAREHGASEKLRNNQPPTPAVNTEMHLYCTALYVNQKVPSSSNQVFVIWGITFGSLNKCTQAIHSPIQTRGVILDSKWDKTKHSCDKKGFFFIKQKPWHFLHFAIRSLHWPSKLWVSYTCSPVFSLLMLILFGSQWWLNRSFMSKDSQHSQPSQRANLILAALTTTTTMLLLWKIHWACLIIHVSGWLQRLWTWTIKTQ